MKHLKKKLAVATSMMVLAAVMLSSVSFAWFTLSTNPEIKNMEATVAANQNLEIALDNGYADEAAVDTASVYANGAQGSTTGNPYTWGNLVDLGVAFADDALVPVFQPVKFTNTSGTVKLEVPKYGVDGRVDSLAELEETIFTDLATVTTPTGGVKGYSVTTENAPYYAFSVDFWARTNVAGDLALQTEDGVYRADDGDATTTTTTNDVNHTAGTGSNITVPGYASMTTEQQAAVEAYFGKLKVAFVTAAGTTVQATLTSNSDGTFDISCAKIVTLARNTAQKVRMYVYLDGEAITNKEALLVDVDNVKFNIQFKNTAITGDQAATGNDA